MAAVLVLAAIAGGCGSGSGTASRSGPANPSAAARANPAAVQVIRAWSQALQRGDIRGAARYFALPSEMINGTGATGQLLGIAIHTRQQAEAANLTLPCGARFVSAEQRGRYVNVLFRLTERSGPGSGCGAGVGQAARTNFLVVGGRIVEWIRAPLDPEDGGGSPPPPAAPQQPPAPPSQQSPAI